MVQFNELRITPDGKHLIVDVQVDPLSYYDNVYIDSIHIDTQDTFIQTGPSSKTIYTYIVPEDINEKVYSQDCGCRVLDEADNEQIYVDEAGLKHLRQIIDLDGIQNNLFFVWVLTKGQPSADTPCGMKEQMVLGVVYNDQPLLWNAMKMLEGLNGCTPDKAFIDFILEREGFDLALKTGNYTKAIEYWKRLFVKKVPKLENHCGCNGAAR